MRFGMHLTFSSGPQRAREIGARALQVFCGNPRGWQKTPLDPEFVSKFRAELKQFDVRPLAVHATYLINMAARDERVYEQSRESLVTEVQRAAQLGAQFYVVHIGNHMGAGAEAGRRRVAACIQAAVQASPQADAPEILVENTAGGGTTLGTTFEEIAALMEVVASPRLGLCLDTCHALAAGYDIRTPAAVKKTLDALERSVGFKRLRCLHVNDSKGDLGSRLDRHEHIGQGRIGAAGFKAFFSDPRLWGLPAILETPRDEPAHDIQNLWRAIEIAVKAGAVPKSELRNRPTEPQEKAASKALCPSRPSSKEKGKRKRTQP